MAFQILVFVAAMARVVQAAPQWPAAPQRFQSSSQRSSPTYQSLGVLQPQTPKDLGDYEKIVSSTIDIIPEIASTFEKLGRPEPQDPDFINKVMLGFMPLPRKVIKANDEVQGQTLSEDEYQAFNAAERVMPFMNRLRKMNFFVPPEGPKPVEPVETVAQ